MKITIRLGKNNAHTLRDFHIFTGNNLFCFPFVAESCKDIYENLCVLKIMQYVNNIYYGHI